jgi:hypothetical protein
MLGVLLASKPHRPGESGRDKSRPSKSDKDHNKPAYPIGQQNIPGSPAKYDVRTEPRQRPENVKERIVVLRKNLSAEKGEKVLCDDLGVKAMLYR